MFHPDPEKGCADILLAGQDDVAAAAGCRTVDSLTVRTGMALDLSPLGRLTTIKGALVVGPSVGLAEVALPRLHSAGSVRIVSNGNLHGVVFRELDHATSVEVEANSALATLSMPSLVSADRLSISDNAELELVDLSKLASITDLAIAKNPKLTMIEGSLPALQAQLPATTE